MNLPWNRANSDLDREVNYHLESLADAYEAEGISRRDAMARARREFGGVDQVKEQCRDESRWKWAVQALQDLRFGIRMMRKSPTISIAAVLSLALGIGATTTIYSFADAVLWRKLGVPAPEQMLEVFWTSHGPIDLLRSSSGSNFRDGNLRVADFFSIRAYDAIRESGRGKVEVAAHIYHRPVSASFQGNVTVAHIRGISDNFFPLLRLQAFRGHLPGGSTAAPEVAVSYRFWDRHLGRSEKAVGQTIRLNNYPYMISGVLPPSFVGMTPGDETSIYARIQQTPALIAPDSWYRAHQADPYSWWVQLIARRAPSVSTNEAQSIINAGFASSWPEQPKTAESTPRIHVVDASTGLGGLRRQLGNPAWILLTLVSMVLVVACANIANLLLARAAEREKEVGLRVSLGCGRGRLMRQFFTESLLIALAGGTLSIAVALSIGSLMGGVLPQDLNAESLMVNLNVQSLAATAAITLMTAALFGLYPAWRTSRIDAGPALREGSGTAGTSSRARLMPARLLVLMQVAMGVLLITSAIAYTGYLTDIVNQDAGFERAHTLLFDIRPGELGYSDERLETFYRNAEDQLRAIPGVVEVGFSRTRPMRGGGYHDGIRIPGVEREFNSAVHEGTAGFLPALGVPLVAGRSFTPQDVHAERPVAILSERLVKNMNLSAPLGARILIAKKEWEVIGVAKDASYSRLAHPLPVTYVPIPKGTPAVTVMLRTSVHPLAVVSAAREAIRQLDDGVPLVDVSTMEQQIARTLQRERMFAWLCGSFGVLALVLCVVGLYGLMSHATSRRTPEIGIRMALGASSQQVRRQVVMEGMRLAAGGLVLGVPIAVYAAQMAQKLRMLPEGPIPYWTLAAAVAVLITSAFLAVFGPALRASSVDPMRALRQG